MKFVEKPGFWVLLMLVYFVIVTGVDLWSYFVTEAPLTFLTEFISIVLSLIFSLAVIKITLNAYANKAYSYSEFLNIFRYLLRYVISFVIYLVVVMIVTFVVAMPFIILAINIAFSPNYGIFSGFSFILALPGMIPGIILAIKLFFFDYFIVDQDLGAVESLKASFRLTKGRLLKLLAFFLAVVLINFGGVLLLGIGLLFTMPVSFLATAYVYKKLLERKSLDLDWVLQKKES